MRLSFNTWLYGQANGWLPQRGLDDTIDAIAEIGYDGIEIGAATPHAYPPFVDSQRRAEIRRRLHSRGIQVSAICPALGGAIGYNSASPDEAEQEATVEYMLQCAQLAHDLESDAIIWIAGWTRYGQTKRQAWSNALKNLELCYRAIAPLGVRLLIEPTAQVSDLTDDAGDVKRLIEEADVDPEVVRVMLDTIHVFHREDDIRAQIREAGSQLGYIHLSDIGRQPPGTINDFRSVIDELKLIGYDDWLSMEIGFSRRDVDPDGTARRAHEYIVSVLDPDNERIASWR